MPFAGEFSHVATPIAMTLPHIAAASPYQLLKKKMRSPNPMIER
jgi:hypothetical protein